MLNCFVTDQVQKAIPITVIEKDKFADWINKQSENIKQWFSATQFVPDVAKAQIYPDANGNIAGVICCVDALSNLWSVGHLALFLPEKNIYTFDTNSPYYESYAIAWGLGAYQFSRYKKPLREAAQLILTNAVKTRVNNILESIYFVRDLINTPTDDMGPSEFAEVAENVAKEFGATFTQIIGDELLKQNYASIYTVGRASDDPPRLLDLRWGDKNHPKVTLVGKGVCFDSGGLDIKPSTYMLLMKKDMAGGAHVLGLARMIMQAKLPINLRILIPLVENVISGNAYRPGDVIKSRKGITVEVGNTDAEGRLILSDALAEASNDQPELLIDIATLTGAARVALGTELPVVFSNNDQVVNTLIKHGEKVNDPMWRLPLYAPYRELLFSTVADINNNSMEPYAGAITAGLFLKEFVPDNIPWLHFDMMAWNLRPKPGRPQGGEAMVLRTLNTDLIEGTYFETINHFKDELFKYIVYYNKLRPHQALSGKTPEQVIIHQRNM